MEKDRTIEDAIRKRLEAPKSYVMDGESITNDSPDDLAKLANMYNKAKAAADPEAGNRSPFRVSVCRNNSTF